MTTPENANGSKKIGDAPLSGGRTPLPDDPSLRGASPIFSPGVKSGADTAEFMYLSQLLGTPVRREGETKRSARLFDVGVRRITTYPQTVCLDVESRGERRMVPWSSVKEFSEREIVLSQGLGASVGAETNGKPAVDFWIRRDVLDDQVVDVKGAKVRRVNDVHLLYAGGHLIIGHVEVGLLGILRRLRLEWTVNGLLRWLLDYEIKESFLGWRWIEVLSPGGSPGGLKVIGEPDRLADMAPAELADVLEQLGARERQTVFNTLSVEAAAEALEAAEPEVQRDLITRQEPGKAADILDEMETMDAAEVLRDVSAGDAQQIISRMETDASEDVREVLRHKEETAGGVMEPSCVTASANDRAGEVLDRIRQAADEPAVLSHVYVLDISHRLVGVLSLREMLRAGEDATLGDLMTMPVISVKPDTRLRDLARLFVKYGFRNIPVVDNHGVLLGTVRFRRVLGELSPFMRE